MKALCLPACGKQQLRYAPSSSNGAEERRDQEMTSQLMKCDLKRGATSQSPAGRLGGVLLGTAALLWAGAAVAQQNPGAQGGMQQQQQQQPQQQQAMPGAATPGTPGTDPTTSYSDMAFVQDTLQNNDAEVQMSQLAQSKSQSADVQQFGQKMVQVHTALNEQLKPAAKALGVNDSKGPSKKEKQEISQLASLSGPGFDTAYIMAMAKEQQKSLKAFKDEEKNTQSPGLQQAAKADEPVLTQHFEVLQKLAQAHNVTITTASK
jgi:putative membrane protein